jgi:hypothetical protein
MYNITTDVELTVGSVRHVLSCLPLGDGNAVTWRVRTWKNGTPFPLSGKTVTCQILKGDGTAGEPIAGTVSPDGFAEAVLTEECHEIPGETRLTMRAEGGGEKAALAVLIYRVL